MSKVASFKMCSSKGESRLMSGDYWAIVVLCSALSFLVLTMM